MNLQDHSLLRRSFQLAQSAREKSNHPFGALLVDAAGKILLEAENTVVTDSDCTAHAELRLVRLASQKYPSHFLATCTLYSSTEPCPMCAGAIFWGNIRRLVFGLSEKGLYQITGPAEMLSLPSRDLFALGSKVIAVVGPLLESEAREVHLGFWTTEPLLSSADPEI